MPSPAVQQAVTPTDLVAAVLARKSVVILFACLGGLAAGTFAFLATPVYEAGAIVAPANNQDGSPISSLSAKLGGGIGQLLGMNPNAAARAVQIATLDSRQLALSFVKAARIEPQLFAERWDAARRTWRSDARAPNDLELTTRFKARALGVDESKTTGLVTVSVKWSDPKVASDWTNAYVAHANAVARKVAIAEADQNLAYLRREFERTRPVEIRQAIAALIESELSRKAIASVRVEYAYRVVDPAQPPLIRIFPRRTLITAGGLVGGGLVGGVLALFAALRTPRGTVAAGTDAARVAPTV